MKRRRASRGLPADAAVPVSPTLIRLQAKQLQGLSLTPKRSKELAQDAARHVAGVAAAASKLEFEDEPSRFVALLDASRDQKRKQ